MKKEIIIRLEYGIIHPDFVLMNKKCQKWCEQNINGNFEPIYLVFFVNWIFDNEEDAIAFKLRWS